MIVLMIMSAVGHVRGDLVFNKFKAGPLHRQYVKLYERVTFIRFSPMQR
jgi:hypothetical protein